MAILTFHPKRNRPTSLTFRPARKRNKKEVSIALEKQADAILRAITGNQCLPTRQELKRMVNAGKWVDISKLFNFEPTFMKTEGGKQCIDWRSVPRRVYELLQISESSRDYHQKQSFRLLEAAPHKKLMSKTSVTTGKREKTYCEQSASCHYCGQYTLFNCWTLDHKTPSCRGGCNLMENLVGSCSTCNKAKSCLNYEEFMSTDFMGGTLPLELEIERVTNLIRGTIIPNHS